MRQTKKRLARLVASIPAPVEEKRIRVVFVESDGTPVDFMEFRIGGPPQKNTIRPRGK